AVRAASGYEQSAGQAAALTPGIRFISGRDLRGLFLCCLLHLRPHRRGPTLVSNRFEQFILAGQKK
ncbi:MAG TPA: hypothetical protein VL177_11485, partial [Terriglobales bacterium]|nr:hypothetical protein [Terriglobales bacterium]